MVTKSAQATLERQRLGIADTPGQPVGELAEVAPLPPGVQHCLIDVRDSGAAATGAQEAQADVTGPAGKIDKMLVGLRRHPVDKGGLPEPVHTAAHQVVHDVVTGRHRIEHVADKPGLLAPPDGAKAEIDAVFHGGLGCRAALGHAVGSVFCRGGISAAGFSGYAAPDQAAPHVIHQNAPGGPKIMSQTNPARRTGRRLAMPELPEVETVRRALVPALENRRVAAAHIGRPDLRWPLPENLADRLTGRRFGGLRRRGKFLLLPLDGDETVLMHLGMSGSVRLHEEQPDIGKHDHMVLQMDGATGRAGWSSTIRAGSAGSICSPARHIR